VEGGFLLLALTASKAVIDYTSSGLENPLSYLVAALFMRSVLDDARGESGEALPARPFLWASLAYLCRPDSVLLYLPALAWTLARSRAPWRRAAAVILVATLPATLWTLFSIVYYGFPFPNTAYAKSFVSGIPFEWKAERGLQYLGNSLHWDAASYAMALAAGVLALRRRSAPTIALLAGVIVYVAGVVLNFASATHMSGRLLALPLFSASCRSCGSWRTSASPPSPPPRSRASSSGAPCPLRSSPRATTAPIRRTRTSSTPSGTSTTRARG
jgi:hypothetical protein